MAISVCREWKDPDQQVRAAVGIVFAKFAELLRTRWHPRRLRHREPDVNDPTLKDPDRTLMTFAAYNAGRLKKRAKVEPQEAEALAAA